MRRAPWTGVVAAVSIVSLAACSRSTRDGRGPLVAAVDSAYGGPADVVFFFNPGSCATTHAQVVALNTVAARPPVRLIVVVLQPPDSASEHRVLSRFGFQGNIVDDNGTWQARLSAAELPQPLVAVVKRGHIQVIGWGTTMQHLSQFLSVYFPDAMSHAHTRENRDAETSR